MGGRPRPVAASFRIERCQRAIEELVATTRERARLAWDQDRAIEAATVFGRLAKDPILVARQLEATLAGVTLMVEAWLGLVSALEKGDWSEAEESKALDLLGVASDLRSGNSLIDAPRESSRSGITSGWPSRRSAAWSRSATRRWCRSTTWSVTRR